MIWKWLKIKLGIKDYEDDLVDLNSKVYLVLKLLGDCMDDYDKFKESYKEFKNQLDSIEKSIKNIPKEIVVKNVLSI